VNGEYWIDSNGTRILIDSMSDSDLLSLLAMTDLQVVAWMNARLPLPHPFTMRLRKLLDEHAHRWCQLHEDCKEHPALGRACRAKEVKS
jgi:hypothetical protein